MTRPRLEPTAEDGYEALRGHLVEKARLARERYGPAIDAGAIERILADGDIVRFPTRLRFDDEPLLPGEFAHAEPRGRRPADGFDLVVHPHFAARPDALPLLAAYHVPSINSLDVATHVEAELFGATLLGLHVDRYYERVCELADELPDMPEPSPELDAALADLARARTEEPIADAGRGVPHGGGRARPRSRAAPSAAGCGGSGPCGCRGDTHGEAP